MKKVMLLILAAAALGMDAAPAVASADNAGTRLEAHWREGQRLLGEGRLEEALSILQEALELDRDQPRTWNYLGGIFFHQRDYFNALLHFKQAYMLNPLDVRACNNMATAYEHMEQYEKAKVFYLRALKIAWTYPTTYRNLGILYAYKFKKPELARRFWKRYVKLVPSGPESDKIRAELALLEEDRE
jgi:Flp pilus assembly protein TadD